ncbi:class I SAM-dependent methyltransferase [Paenibacillus pinihumi]|uniref:class I SAM-dependent methyltransferase n=1 Tax=Paenibacillus pinihumi TaxID=669462 RepID=UPI0004263095|nr:class I SAM-dependent methyltransferase [Paenibacillus pinihumi]
MNYHDLLARLGEGSAHPGGFLSTKRLLEQQQLPQGSRVLEIGCGTGRTSCYLARSGCEVTAVDSNKAMIEQASKRIAREEAEVRLLHADACNLPFEDDTFDLVFIESVTVFTEAAVALKEYRRVLRPGGKLLDREMILTGADSTLLRGSLKALYGMKTLAREEGWLQMLEQAGFQNAAALDVKAEILVTLDDVDMYREVDPTVFFDDQAFYLGQMNARILERYGKKLGSAVFTGTS